LPLAVLFLGGAEGLRHRLCTRYTKVRYRGLKKNTLQLKTLFALSNLWMVRYQLLAAQG